MSEKNQPRNVICKLKLHFIDRIPTCLSLEVLTPWTPRSVDPRTYPMGSTGPGTTIVSIAHQHVAVSGILELASHHQLEERGLPGQAVYISWCQ